MSQYCTKEGRRISVFSPITQRELEAIPDARTWHGRDDLIGPVAYQQLQMLVIDAFADESPDYILGFVSGFNGAMDRVRDMMNDEDVTVEATWNNLMLLLSEAARYLDADTTDDHHQYLELPVPGSEDN